MLPPRSGARFVSHSHYGMMRIAAHFFGLGMLRDWNKILKKQWVIGDFANSSATAKAKLA